MKKNYLLLLMILSSMFIVSCGKQEENSDASTAIIDNKPVVEEQEAFSEPEIDEEEEEDTMDQFYILEIDDEIFSRIKGLSYKDDCIVPVEELSYLHILHKNLYGDTLEGELIVNKKIAEITLDIFKQLYQANYPIESVKLVDEFNADDETSMAANNSSAFNFRFISYTTTVSKHGLGMAIDINPRYNPYVKEVNGKLSIEPANGADYVDRDKSFDYKIDENDLAYKLFTEAGFEWGGSWKNSKDYQHFEMD